ncbi:YybH family protein [Trinickia diaoshuihuensis]|jgi:uncharacterized protein (TIGR02246 family)|uniref:YybH family protein n=1 Tax=Trinickia diaoshuihuensis TaxID=2292265 RepID=UPI000E25B29C|nr:SgcJ/EcaC family oxidoreductase [Trinickia diaoshuihuensis]
MTEFKPEDLHRQFEEAFNSGDLEALLALYVPDARLMAQPGQIVTGHVAIREALKPALAIKGRLTVTTVYAVQAGDIAMMQAQSQLNGVAPDGQQVVLSSKTSEVAQRQHDGRWRFLIDNPNAGQ